MECFICLKPSFYNDLIYDNIISTISQLVQIDQVLFTKCFTNSKMSICMECQILANKVAKIFAQIDDLKCKLNIIKNEVEIDLVRSQGQKPHENHTSRNEIVQDFYKEPFSGVSHSKIQLMTDGHQKEILSRFPVFKREPPEDDKAGPDTDDLHDHNTCILEGNLNFEVDAPLPLQPPSSAILDHVQEPKTKKCKIILESLKLPSDNISYSINEEPISSYMDRNQIKISKIPKKRIQPSRKEQNNKLISKAPKESKDNSSSGSKGLLTITTSTNDVHPCPSTNDVLPCPIVNCDVILNSDQDLLLHLKNSSAHDHLGEISFQCRICYPNPNSNPNEIPKTFKSMSGLVFHSKIEHGNENPVKCPHCPPGSKAAVKIFKNQYHLHWHTKRAHDLPIQCTDCGKAVNKNYYKKHKLLHQQQRQQKGLENSEVNDLPLQLQPQGLEDNENNEKICNINEESLELSLDNSSNTISVLSTSNTSSDDKNEINISKKKRVQPLRKKKYNKSMTNVSEYCTKRFNGSTSGLVGLKGVQTNNIHPCPVINCDSILTSDRKLLLHLSKKSSAHDHLGEILFQCRNCPNESLKTFKSMAGLVFHSKIEHGEENPVKCPHCPPGSDAALKVFKNQYHLRWHTKRAHEAPNIQCEDCGRVVSKNHYKKHKSIHQQKKLNLIVEAPRERNFLCEICSKAFLNPTTLKAHRTFVHFPEEISYTCEICAATVKSKSGLTSHLANVHQIGTIIQVQCPVCLKMCKSKPYLRSHMQIHTKSERLFTCDFPNCTKSFKSMKYLKKHSYIHNGKNSRTCPFCYKVITSSYNLKYHIEQVHSDGKNYVCDICQDKSFKLKRQLTIHKQKYHSSPTQAESTQNSTL